MQTSSNVASERARGAHGGDDDERRPVEGAEAARRLATVTRDLGNALVSMSGFVARLRAHAAPGSMATDARALDDALTTSMALVRTLRAHAELPRATAASPIDDDGQGARAADAICIEVRGAAAASRVAAAVSGLAESLRGSIEIGGRAGGGAAIVIHVSDAC